MVAGVAATLFACGAGAARADVATVPNDGSDPSAGGVAVTSPLESVAGAIASTIAGRTVSVRCEGDTDWQTLASSAGFASSNILGFVSFYDAQPVDFAELSPDTCRSLEAFAAATVKPTKCAQTTRRIVRKNRRRRVVTSAVLGPCFVDGREISRDQSFWDAYFYTASAIQTLVHESQHLKGDPIEAEAECYGMQWIAYAAQQLGDTADDAAAIAQYYATRVYPERQTQTPEYWSPECREGGALDLTPNDGNWP